MSDGGEQKRQGDEECDHAGKGHREPRAPTDSRKSDEPRHAQRKGSGRGNERGIATLQHEQRTQDGKDGDGDPTAVPARATEAVQYVFCQSQGASTIRIPLSPVA